MRATLRLLGSACALAAASCAAPDDGYPAFERALKALLATVADSSGDLQVKHQAQGFWEPAGPASCLFPGDWLKTGKGSSARLEFRGGGALELDEDAVLVVEALRPVEKKEPGLPDSIPLVAVEAGSVRSSLADRKGAARPLYVRTAEGTEARLEGRAEAGPTELRVARVGAATEVVVNLGEVRLASGGREESVAAGAAATVGKSGIRKVALLPAPAPSEPAAEARVVFAVGTPLALTWAPVPEAAGYRVRVAPDPGLRRPAVAKDVGEPRLEVELPRLGAWWWRVWARDANGRLGASSAPRRFFLVDKMPEEALSEPPDGAAYGFADQAPRITFSWRAHEGASAYRLVIATSPDLETGVAVSEVTGETFLQVGTLQPGEYHWGAFVQGASQEPLFIRPRRLTVKKVKGSAVTAPNRIKRWGE